MRKRKEKSDQNAVAELTREGLYKENKWLWEENKKLKDSNTILKKGGQVVFTLEKRIDELLEENKNLNEEIENHKQNIMQDELEIIPKLEQENSKLKEDNRFLTKISKEYMKKENIIEVTEFTELYKDELEEENKKLKAELESRINGAIDTLREVPNK